MNKFNLPGNGNGILQTIVRFSQKLYALDYIGLALLIVALLVSQSFEPFHQLFSLSDSRIAYPHALHERVPVSMLFVYAVGVPLGGIILYMLVSRASIHKAHVSLLGLGLTLVLSELLTNMAKNAIGRPRPDLLDRCKAREGTPTTGLVSVDVCTETNHHILHDGWRSFPSGHSSFSWAGLGYLSLILAGQLRTLRTGTDAIRCLVPLIPLIAAAGVAISRLEDYRHDPYDVTAGSLLGMSVAYLSYRRYYPRLRSRDCSEPWGVPGSENEKRGDEEMGRMASAGEFELANDEDSEDEREGLQQNGVR